MIEANPFNTMPSPVNRIPTAFSRSAISLSFLFDTICFPPFYDLIIHRIALFINAIRLILLEIYTKIRPVPTEIAGTGLLFTSSLPKHPILWPIFAIGFSASWATFQSFRVLSGPPASLVWPVVMIDWLLVLSSRHSRQSWKARSSADEAVWFAASAIPCRSQGVSELDTELTHF